jgi:hypothetical protein
MQKTLITQRLIDSPLISEEELKELQRCQREYDIECLRTKIKNTAEEYNVCRQIPYIAGAKFDFYRKYLLEQIEQNIEELKELMEQNNE